LELETLVTGALAKRRLWNTLRFVEPSDGQLDAGELDRLAERADRQLEELERQHRLAVIVAFAGADRNG
jgi:hypothetical protein